MTFSFKERPGSGASTKDSAELWFRASGSDSEAYVRNAALALTPAAVSITEGFLYRQDVLVHPKGHKLFFVDAVYGKRKKENGSYTLSFDTTGGTIHMKTSLETVDRYPDTAADHKGAINRKGDGEVEGAEIVIPALRLTVNFRHPMGVITLPQIRRLARATACVNSDTFLGFKPGEVLLLGAKGSEGSDVETEVSYDFACSENAAGLSIGDITGIEKAGHDLVWVSFKPAVDGGKACTQPLAAYVERVYKRISMSQTLGFGG